MEIPYKDIQHCNWKFQYNLHKNIFTTDIESYDKCSFTQNENTPDAGVLLQETDLDDFRKAGLIHKVARKKALTLLYTGCKLSDLVDGVETIILQLCGQNPKTYYLSNDQKSGIAFPVGVNINNIVAYDSKTVTILDNRQFYKGDVVKIVIGVHINGRIIDSGFTHIITDKPGVHDINNIYNNVLEASREAMFNVIKMSGPEQNLFELSECIDEIIRSYEVDLGGDTLPINPVNGLGGNNIEQYIPYGNKKILTIPNIKIQYNDRMCEDEVYSIKTYATTGYGMATSNNDLSKCTHYMEYNDGATTNKQKKFFRRTELYNWLQTRKGLPYSSSWIDGKISKQGKSYNLGLTTNQLIAYQPLNDEENAVVSHFGHTIHIRDGTTEIFSLGEDY
jgi:methionyl aminopeptidase